MFYTYLLHCGDGSLYAGITTDPARRLKEHRGGGKRGARYTRYRAPLTMAALWMSESRGTAASLEARLKKASHAVKERLAEEPALLGDLIKLPEGAVYTPVTPPVEQDAP
ncbi:MAG: GIY-YIG nuclease family protein [Clostridia bacterium]|nr:GIY-YIG nuclease family protein [Clostridia bacterium]